MGKSGHTLSRPPVSPLAGDIIGGGKVPSSGKELDDNPDNKFPGTSTEAGFIQTASTSRRRRRRSAFVQKHH
jgi:hypothetical protein